MNLVTERSAQTNVTHTTKGMYVYDRDAIWDSDDPDLYQLEKIPHTDAKA